MATWLPLFLLDGFRAGSRSVRRTKQETILGLGGSVAGAGAIAQR